MQLHGHTPHHKPLHVQANKSSTTTSTCTIVVGTYYHASPILFGWFFVEASPTCFIIFVKYIYHPPKFELLTESKLLLHYQSMYTNLKYVIFAIASQHNLCNEHQWFCVGKETEISPQPQQSIPIPMVCMAVK